MKIQNSNTGIYHIVLGTASEGGVFFDKSDYREFMDIVRVYKDFNNIKLFGYSLTPLVIHLVIYNRSNEIEEFLHNIIDTYSIYINKKYLKDKIFHRNVKVKAIERYESFLNIFKHMHKTGQNSLKRFENYNFSKKDMYLNADYVLSTFGCNREKSKEEMTTMSVQECPNAYDFYIKELEFFPKEKRNVRLRRAEMFLDNFLNENEINRSDLEMEDNYNKKLELVKSFRMKTDVSYRDIGSLLGLSHTSVIRLWRKSYDSSISLRLS